MSHIAAPPAKFTVKLVEIVNHDVYPAVKIVFETDKYPITFYLLTPEGAAVYSYTATEPEKVVYLYLTPGEPYANIVNERHCIVKAYYLGKEIWRKEIVCKGVKPKVRV